MAATTNEIASEDWEVFFEELSQVVEAIKTRNKLDKDNTFLKIEYFYCMKISRSF